MRLISIDPGYDKVGYAVFDKNPNKNTAFAYIASDLIKTNKSDPHEQRLKQIYDTLNLIIKKYEAKLMIIEELFVFKNQKTVIKVAQSIGVIELVAAHNHLAMSHLTPLQIKSIITGYGTAATKAVQKMIGLTIKEPIPFKDDDQTDAIACGLAYCFLNEDLIGKL